MYDVIYMVYSGRVYTTTVEAESKDEAIEKLWVEEAGGYSSDLIFKIIDVY